MFYRSLGPNALLYNILNYYIKISIIINLLLLITNNFHNCGSNYCLLYFI